MSAGSTTAGSVKGSSPLRWLPLALLALYAALDCVLQYALASTDAAALLHIPPGVIDFIRVCAATPPCPPCPNHWPRYWPPLHRSLSNDLLSASLCSPRCPPIFPSPRASNASHCGPRAAPHPTLPCCPLSHPPLQCPSPPPPPPHCPPFCVPTPSPVSDPLAAPLLPHGPLSLTSHFHCADLYIHCTLLRSPSPILQHSELAACKPNRLCTSFALFTTQGLDFVVAAGVPFYLFICPEAYCMLSEAPTLVLAQVCWMHQWQNPLTSHEMCKLGSYQSCSQYVILKQTQEKLHRMYVQTFEKRPHRVGCLW